MSEEEKGELSVQTKTPEMPGKREVTVKEGQVVISGEGKRKGKVERSLLEEVIKRFPKAKASEFPDLVVKFQAETQEIKQGREEVKEK